MAAKKGTREAVKAIVALATEYANELSVLGAPLLMVACGSVYATHLRTEVETVRLERRLLVENARIEGRMQAETAEKCVEAKVKAKLEAAQQETAEKFLKLGFTEEYSNYQKVMKLHQEKQHIDK